jgi:hypothetical protein
MRMVNFPFSERRDDWLLFFVRNTLPHCDQTSDRQHVVDPAVLGFTSEGLQA